MIPRINPRRRVGRFPTLAATGLALLAAVWSGSALARPASADLVFRGGYVVTVDAGSRVASAVAVREGRIIYVGDDAGVKHFIGKGSEVVDLHGRMLMPGLVDGHMHPLAGGFQLLKCNLNYEPLTIGQFQARIQACLDKTREREPDGLLEVVNWFQQDMQPSGTQATHETLDALDTRRPIAVQSSFGHSVLVNARAMQLAGITAATPDPVAGKVTHDASGQPTGILEDAAQDLLRNLRPPPTEADNVAAAKAALDALRRQGITSFLSAAAYPAEIDAFAAVQRQGGLTARAHFAPVIRPVDGAQPQAAVAAVADLARRYDQGPLVAAPTITVRNAKLFMDGVITAPAFTGAMIDPYFSNHGTADHPQWAPGADKGPPPYFPAPILAELLIRLAEAGLDPHLHADGDGAVRAALDGIQAMHARYPDRDIRPAIAHDEIVDPADFGRFRQLGALPVLSFQWAKPAPDTIDGAQTYLGPARFRVFEPEGLLQAAGARIAYGSDWPVDALNEWFALKVGVTRTNAPEAGPRYRGRLSADPGLSRQVVVRAITLNASYELHQDAQTGSLQVGKLADLIVLDRNLFKVPAEDIAHVKVLMTVVGGKVVYRAGGS